jgi:hypothetical protein
MTIPLVSDVGPVLPRVRGGGASAALDQETLFRAGLDHVQRLSRRIWTDYNVHDPGITTLELLCYALTDLGFRASLPVEDLLATETDADASMRAQFFGARRILPNRPLTTLDYRKLLLDSPDIRNAWILPAPLTFFADRIAGTLLHANPGGPSVQQVDVKGLYRVVVELEDGSLSDENRQRVLDAAMAKLQANRNLCEEFVAVSSVETQKFIICGDIDLAANADATRVKAEILFAVHSYLTPRVRNYSLSEMLERHNRDGIRYSADEIFDGPALDHGFIDSLELERSELVSEIRLSDVISIIMDVEGVEAVRDLVVNPLGDDGNAIAPKDKWAVPVDAGHQPILDRSRSQLLLRKRDIPVHARFALVDELYAKMIADERAWEDKAPGDIPIPVGRYRDAARYYSVQNHFPAVYGLNDSGTAEPNDVTALRRRLDAFQLKGYLLFFDHMMAAYCAQLAHARDLYSWDGIAPDERVRSYFSQTVSSFRNSESLYREVEDEELEDLLETDEEAIARRNRFLDHLIGRFAERFHEYAEVAYSVLNSSPRQLLRLKREFLSVYPELGAERGLGVNNASGKPVWDTRDVSGLEHRIARLVGIRNWARRDLGDVTLGPDAEVEGSTADGFLFRIRSDDGRVLFSSTTKFPTQDAATEALRQAIHAAQIPLRLELRQANDGRFFFNVLSFEGNTLARHPSFYATAADADAAMSSAVETISARYGEEGLYLFENIALRPTTEKDTEFLPICVDPNCTDCAEEDPYSYRIHVVLPAYAGRFSVMEFRRFVESVIREETPAHILPTVCWIGREDMARLQKVYRAWLELPDDAGGDDRSAALIELRDVLYSVKNVYPTANLAGCGDAEERPEPFRLGRTALGTQPE